jgi:hypothetical protein
LIGGDLNARLARDALVPIFVIAGLAALTLVLLVLLNVVRVVQARQTLAFIDAHIAPGLTRKDTYRLLAGRHLVASNADYALYRRTAAGCRYDDSTANWPYRNEPLSSTVRNGCGQVDSSPDDMHEPRADVDIPGPLLYLIMCQQNTRVTIDFDATDRVKTVAVEDRGAACL